MFVGIASDYGITPPTLLHPWTDSRHSVTLLPRCTARLSTLMCVHVVIENRSQKVFNLDLLGSIDVTVYIYRHEEAVLISGAIWLANIGGISGMRPGVAEAGR